MEEIIQLIFVKAKALGCCDKFKGTEDLDSLVALFQSPQGIEFCKTHHFPDLSLFRLLKPYKLHKYGIYIDAGQITLRNPQQAFLIGNTKATIFCDTSDYRNNVHLFHNAHADIKAKEWSVTFVDVENGSYTKDIQGNAIVL